MRVFLALGSNLGDRLGHIQEALRLLSGRCRLIKISSIYETPAMYYTRQGNFYNAAAEIETGFSPLELLRETQSVERAMKRKRNFKNSPRTLDIDIIFYGQERIEQPGLMIPHPKLAERPFVLAPLCEIAPRLRHPISKIPMCALLAGCPGAASGASRLPANYKEALAYLNGLPPSASFSPAPVRNALEKLGRPQDSFYALHVAGTNGKGSVCAMLAGALNNCGYKTGLYLSPHITGPLERISLAGRKITEADFFRLFCAVRSFGFRLSYFEHLTVMAFLWFKERGARFAVVEAGLGGRLDATNVFKKSLAIISGISLEHAGVLGGSIKSISAHKAGIIRAGCNAVTSASGPALAVIRRRAASTGSRLFQAEPDKRFQAGGANIFYRSARPGSRRLRLALKGGYQLQNAALAMKALDALRTEGYRIPAGLAAAGLSRARLEGRFEIIRSAGIKMIFDGAHNPAAMEALFAAMHGAGFDRPVTLAAIMDDKAAAGMIGMIGSGSRAVVFSGVNSPRALRPAGLARMGISAGYEAHSEKTPALAFELARRLARENGSPLLITGSFYLIAEIKAIIKSSSSPVFPRELSPQSS